MFQPNQKITCIDDEFTETSLRLYKQLPTKGKTYTVRKCGPGRGQGTNTKPGATPLHRILLVELVNPPDPFSSEDIELGFLSNRFEAANTQTEPESPAHAGAN